MVRVIFCFILVVATAALGNEHEFLGKLAKAALDRTRLRITYDPSYVKIPYPGGDVAKDRGVCSDVIIRSYRVLGIDLQKEVHEDMKANFKRYPKEYGLKKPDPNIDHRRVPNLMVFFGRKGKSLALTRKGVDYKPGELVVWDLLTGQKHLGLVVDRKVEGSDVPLIVHNVGEGDVLEDVLFRWPIVGHYRYLGPKRGT